MVLGISGVSTIHLTLQSHANIDTVTGSSSEPILSAPAQPLPAPVFSFPFDGDTATVTPSAQSEQIQSQIAFGIGVSTIQMHNQLSGAG